MRPAKAFFILRLALRADVLLLLMGVSGTGAGGSTLLLSGGGDAGAALSDRLSLDCLTNALPDALPSVWLPKYAPWFLLYVGCGWYDMAEDEARESSDARLPLRLLLQSGRRSTDALGLAAPLNKLRVGEYFERMDRRKGGARYCRKGNKTQ